MKRWLLAGLLVASSARATEVTWTVALAAPTNAAEAASNVICWCNDPANVQLGNAVLFVPPLPKTFPTSQCVSSPVNYGPGKTIVVRCAFYTGTYVAGAPASTTQSGEVSVTYTFPVPPANLRPPVLSHN